MRDRYTDPRLYEDGGHIDEHGHYRDAGDYRDGPPAQGGLVLWATIAFAMLGLAGAFGWGLSQAFRLLEKLLGL